MIAYGARCPPSIRQMRRKDKTRAEEQETSRFPIQRRRSYRLALDGVERRGQGFWRNRRRVARTGAGLERLIWRYKSARVHSNDRSREVEKGSAVSRT